MRIFFVLICDFFLFELNKNNGEIYGRVILMGFLIIEVGVFGKFYIVLELGGFWAASRLGEILVVKEKKLWS